MQIAIKYYSWELLSDKIALKTIDKSVFLYNMTGVPKGIRSFFGYELKEGKHKVLKFKFSDKIYEVKFELGKNNSPRTRIIWKLDFKDLIKSQLFDYYKKFKNNKDVEIKDLPKIRFEKFTPDIYFIEFITPEKINMDNKNILESEKTDYNGFLLEGNKKYYFSTKY